MPKTAAERQRAWRERRARLIAALEAERAQLRAELGDVRGQLANAPRRHSRRRPLPHLQQRHLVTRRLRASAYASIRA